ncbi:MAG: hypothetical protein HN576_08820 [Bacteriovoracaceae bacterium]|jgi:hypothetical protein|nr:hypothetical protein [Bacteriovoracaceae bacterium]
MNVKCYFIILNIFFLSSTTLAKESGFDLYTGIGNLSEFPGQVQIDNKGATNPFFFKPTLQIGIKYDFWGNFSLNPEFILTLPEKGQDPLISKFNYFTLLSAAYKYQDFLFRFGFGFSIQKISGEGGTQALNNGLSTDEFPMPEASSISRNLITLLGVEYFILKKLSVRTDVFAYNIEENLNRALSYNVSLFFHFGDLDLFNNNTKKKRQRKRRRRKRKKPIKNKDSK